MKSKPAILIYFVCLLAAALVFRFSGVALAQKNPATQSRNSKEPVEPVKKDADYWFNKGALVSTYGNNKAAVQYFQKAIALDPNLSRAYFSQGVSYGQLMLRGSVRAAQKAGMYRDCSSTRRASGRATSS